MRRRRTRTRGRTAANDNVSGFTAVMEIGRSLGKLLKRGWQPDRTIVLAGWDGEEYGLLGSTEYGEQFAARSDANAVAYVNMDGVGGPQFGAGGVPSARQADRGRHQDRAGPGRRADLRRLEGRRRRRRRSTGSAAARTTRCSSTTSACRRWRSAYSTPAAASTTRPTTTPSRSSTSSIRAISGTRRRRGSSGVHALRLANADALPLRYSDYAAQVDAYVAELQQIQQTNPDAAQVDLTPLREAAQRLGRGVGGAGGARRRRSSRRRLAAVGPAAAGSTGR